MQRTSGVDREAEIELCEQNGVDKRAAAAAAAAGLTNHSSPSRGRRSRSADVAVRSVSLIALVLVILGLALLIVETIRSLVLSYNITTHSIKWVPQKAFYTTPAVLSKVIRYDEVVAPPPSDRYNHTCQVFERVNLKNIRVNEANVTKLVKVIDGEDWYLCEGPSDWRKQTWLHVEVHHGPVPEGLMNTNVGTLLYILPNYHEVKHMSNEELFHKVRYARMLYVNPHTYVEISLQLLRDIDRNGVIYDHLTFYPDRSPGDRNKTQAFVSWATGIYEERQEVKSLSNWSILISVCAFFVTLERMHSVATRLSGVMLRNKP